MKFIGRGLGHTGIYIASQTAGVTAGNAGSGFFTAILTANLVGTTYPGTLVSMQIPPAPPQPLFTTIASSVTASGRPAFFVRFYLLGTLNLAATGNQFTHNAATFPLLRTQLGVASQPITLLPMIYITTATATTAPIFRLRTVAGAAGYVNQLGNSIVGTRTMTMPLAATVAQSGFIIRLEAGDSGIQNITNIEVTTAGSAGAASIYGIELLSPFNQLNSGWLHKNDQMFGGLSMVDLVPAVATSGTVTSILGQLILQTQGASQALSYSTVLNGT